MKAIRNNYPTRRLFKTPETLVEFLQGAGPVCLSGNGTEDVGTSSGDPLSDSDFE